MENIIESITVLDAKLGYFEQKTKDLLLKNGFPVNTIFWETSRKWLTKHSEIKILSSMPIRIVVNFYNNSTISTGERVEVRIRFYINDAIDVKIEWLGAGRDPKRFETTFRGFRSHVLKIKKVLELPID